MRPKYSTPRPGAILGADFAGRGSITGGSAHRTTSTGGSRFLPGYLGKGGFEGPRPAHLRRRFEKNPWRPRHEDLARTNGPFGQDTTRLRGLLDGGSGSVLRSTLREGPERAQRGACRRVVAGPFRGTPFPRDRDRAEKRRDHGGELFTRSGSPSPGRFEAPGQGRFVGEADRRDARPRLGTCRTVVRRHRREVSADTPDRQRACRLSARSDGAPRLARLFGPRRCSTGFGASKADGGLVSARCRRWQGSFRGQRVGQRKGGVEDTRDLPLSRPLVSQDSSRERGSAPTTRCASRFTTLGAGNSPESSRSAPSAGRAADSPISTHDTKHRRGRPRPAFRA